MFAVARLPPPLGLDQAAKRCKACSLLDRCQPEAGRANLMAARANLFDPDA
jgi:CRISPR-associated exonuclease Cas4